MSASFSFYSHSGNTNKTHTAKLFVCVCVLYRIGNLRLKTPIKKSHKE